MFCARLEISMVAKIQKLRIPPLQEQKFVPAVAPIGFLFRDQLPEAVQHLAFGVRQESERVAGTDGARYSGGSWTFQVFLLKFADA